MQEPRYMMKCATSQIVMGAVWMRESAQGFDEGRVGVGGDREVGKGSELAGCS